MQENGRVFTDSEECMHFSFEDSKFYPDRLKYKPLKVKKKLYEFYTAPITKFWANSVSESATNFITVFVIITFILDCVRAILNYI